MRILRRKMLRDLWRIRWRALAVALTVAAGLGVYAGIGMAIATGFRTREVLLDRMRFADLEIQLLPEDVANLPDLTRIPGVTAVERRLVLPGTVLLADDRRLSGVLVFLEAAEPTMDVLEVTEGSRLRPHDVESAVVERSLAVFHGCRVGDRIRVQVGEQTYESRIDGVAISPEWLVATANPDYFIPDKGALGVVFTNLARVSDALGFTMVNDLLIRFEPGADRRAVTDAVVERLGRLNLERVIPKHEHFIWRYVQHTMEAFEIYTPSIVVTLGSLSFVLTLITVNRLVLDQRREIGALLALGYRRAQIVRSYLDAGALLGAAGGVLGVGLSFVLRDLFAGTYARALGMPEIVPVVNPGLLAIGLVASVIETVAATTLPVWRMLRLSPQAIVREPVSEGLAVQGWIHQAFIAMAVLPLPVRFGLRNMMRRPGRTLSTILAIGASLGVSISYLMSVTSTLATAEVAFARDRWDLAVDFLYPVLLEDLEPIRAAPAVANVEPYLRRFAEVGVDGRYEIAGILGVRPDGGMKRPLLKAGRFLSGQPDEVVVSHDIIRRVRLRVGDRVMVRIRSGREFPFRVVGISGEIVPAQVMMSFSRAQAITAFEGAATGVYVATSGQAPRLPAALLGLEYVAKVTTKQGALTAVRKLMSEILQLVYVSAAVSLAVAMLFIFISVNLAISERRAEYATFKCLGYSARRLGAMVLAQAFAEGGLAALASVPVAIVLTLYLNARLSQAWYEVLDVFRANDVLQIVGIAFLLIPLSSYPGLRMLNRLKMADALGTRLIE